MRESYREAFGHDTSEAKVILLFSFQELLVKTTKGNLISRKKS
jgi:hypothetical protein